MTGINKVILLGRIGMIEGKVSESGKEYCNMNIATNKTFKKDGQKEQSTEWHRVIFYSKQAEIANKYAKKGDLIYVEGEIQTVSYETEEGEKKYSTRIIGKNLQLLGAKSENNIKEMVNHEDELHERKLEEYELQKKLYAGIK